MSARVTPISAWAAHMSWLAQFGEASAARDLGANARMFDEIRAARARQMGDQADVLEREGCQSLQGYPFSKPVAAETVAALLDDGASYQRQLRA